MLVNSRKDRHTLHRPLIAKLSYPDRNNSKLNCFILNIKKESLPGKLHVGWVGVDLQNH